MSNPKGITASIYRDGPSDYSNGGTSAKVKQVTVLCPNGVFEPSPDAPAVKIVKRMIGGKPCIHAETVEPGNRVGMVGPMWGGTYIASSDSRFSEATGIYGAIALHDRWETSAQYASNSL